MLILVAGSELQGDLARNFHISSLLQANSSENRQFRQHMKTSKVALLQNSHHRSWACRYRIAHLRNRYLTSHPCITVEILLVLAEDNIKWSSSQTKTAPLIRYSLHLITEVLKWSVLTHWMISSPQTLSLATTKASQHPSSTKIIIMLPRVNCQSMTLIKKYLVTNMA